jgi:DNA-directed RNA polymerase alpha subunit
MQEILEAGGSLRSAACDVLMKRGLAESTAKRRAAAIVSLAEFAGDEPGNGQPDSAESDRDESASESCELPIERGPQLVLKLAQPGLDVQALSPPSLIQNTLQSLDIETTEDLLAIDEERLNSISGVGKKKVAAFRELQARALLNATLPVESEDDSSPVDLMVGWREALPELSVRAFNSLEKTNAATVGDVFRLLKDNAITSIPGAGAVTKRDVQDNLLDYFQRALTAEVELPKARAESHMTDSLSVDVLIHLGTRSANAVERHPATTIGQLRVALVDGTLAQQKGVGRSSLKEIREHIERLREHGEEVYRFGERGRPKTYGELVEQILEQSDDNTRRVVEGRLHGRIYDDLGQELGFTRARAQQLFVRAIEDSRLLFGRVAETLMAPEIMKLARPGGLFVAESEYDANQAEFALEVAGHDANVVRKRVVTRMSSNEVDAVMKELRAALQATGATSVSLEEALDIAEESGLMVEAAELEFLAFDYLNIRKLAEDRLGFPWSNYGDLLAEVLLDIGKTADTDAILARLDEMRATRPALAELPDFAPHAARNHFQSTQHIWNYGHGDYVHIDCLDVSPEQIHAAAKAGLERLRGRTDSIGANYLLDDLVAAGEAVPGLTPHLLKDAIHRHPKGLTFQNTLLVAHADSFAEDGVTLTDRLVDLMVQTGEPMKFGAIKKAMAKYGYAETSIYQHIIGSPEFLVLPGGEYTAARALGLSADDMQTIADAVAIEVRDEGAVYSADAVYLQLPEEVRALLRGNVPSLHVLEGVLRHDDRIEARHGLLARASGEDHLLTKTVELILEDMGCAYPREVRCMLTDAYGYTGSGQAVASALQRLVEAGDAIRLPGALYSLRGADETETWRGWENHHETLLASGRHVEVETEDPWSVWTLIRYIERVIDEDDLAEAMMDRMLGRDDVPDELRESIHDLKFALSMGMG